MLRIVTCALLAASLAGTALAETKEVRVAQQFGISYLPLTVMKEKRLLEAAAKAAGLGDVKVSWTVFSAGNAMNDALISGNLDFASGGVGPFMTIWARTKGNLNVGGVASMNSMPLYLNTVNPAVKTIKDFGDKDRIALPAVKVSIQAVTLQMAAEAAFGVGKHDALDKLTVSMSHPDGMAAMMSGRSEITAHFTSAPFMYQQLEDSKVRRVLNSYDVLGGPSTFNVIWAAAKFRAENPKTYAAFVSALSESMRWISADKRAAAQLYVDAEKAKLTVDWVEKLLRDPENVFTTQPQNLMKYAEFMHRTGMIKVKPADWKEPFFPEIHGGPGS
ncbi:MAG: ABC transporter substrate-binding protein [Alphaproteobacteria bacterium]|nr:ABC transporter substrate-binding protein [Alphaproteobacteria bacterium]